MYLHDSFVPDVQIARIAIAIYNFDLSFSFSIIIIKLI